MDPCGLVLAWSKIAKPYGMSNEIRWIDRLGAKVLLRAPKDQNGNPDKQQRIQELSKCSQVLVDDILSCCIKIIEEVH